MHHGSAKETQRYQGGYTVQKRLFRLHPRSPFSSGIKRGPSRFSHRRAAPVKIPAISASALHRPGLELVRELSSRSLPHLGLQPGGYSLQGGVHYEGTGSASRLGLEFGRRRHGPKRQFQLPCVRPPDPRLPRSAVAGNQLQLPAQHRQTRSTLKCRIGGRKRCIQHVASESLVVTTAQVWLAPPAIPGAEFRPVVGRRQPGDGLLVLLNGGLGGILPRRFCNGGRTDQAQCDEGDGREEEETKHHGDSPMRMLAPVGTRSIQSSRWPSQSKEYESQPQRREQGNAPQSWERPRRRGQDGMGGEMKGGFWCGQLSRGGEPVPSPVFPLHQAGFEVKEYLNRPGSVRDLDVTWLRRWQATGLPCHSRERMTIWRGRATRLSSGGVQ